MTLLLSICLALVLDYLFKEPLHFHPLVGFGKWASWIDNKLNNGLPGRWRGALAWSIVVLTVLIPFSLLSSHLSFNSIAQVLIGGFILYLAIGWQSLLDHAIAIAKPLGEDDLEYARSAVSMIISRDTQTMGSSQIAAAATESVLENGADAVFSTIFWFALLGAPGAVLYRLSNTLDAMWGYKNDRYLHFGWAAARIDDLLNFIPARLTALSYAIAGNFDKSLEAWKAQASNWKSPNAGVVMASGAGAINTILGGGATYHGKWQDRPILGPEDGETPSVSSIKKACTLVNRALVIWVSIIGLMGILLT